MERRYITREIGEMRADTDGDTPSIVGYASLFDSPYAVGPFTEVIKPGAFNRSIDTRKVVALFNHDDNYPLGNNRRSTLTLSEDDKGLFFRLTVGNQSYAKDLLESIERGDVEGASIGFVVSQENYEVDGEDVTREILDVDLWDVSPVTFPANAETVVSVRSFEEYSQKRNRKISTPYLANAKRQLIIRDLWKESR